MIATPIYDEVVKLHPYPESTGAGHFSWPSPPPTTRTVAPKPGQKPAAARKGRRGGRR